MTATRTFRGRMAVSLFLGVAAVFACTPQDDGPPPAVALEAGDTILIGVTLLRPADASQRPAHNVAIRGDSILRVWSGAVGLLPDGVTVIDAGGRYLMPGLWEFHSHVSMADPHAMPLLVTHGVLGTRDLGGFQEQIEELENRIARREMLGPRILHAGPTLNGAQNGPHHRVIDSAESAQAAVSELKESGVDLLKTHNATGREAYFALLEAASEAGLQVAGHVPVTVEPLEACRAGQASIEHIVTLFEGVYQTRFSSETESLAYFDTWLTEEAPELVDCLVEEGTLFVPTLATYEARAHRAALFDNPPAGWEYLTAENQVAFREANVPSDRERDPSVIAARERVVTLGQQFARIVHEAGGNVATGTDFAGSVFVPGLGVHREIELLVEGGIPAPAAIWASARGPGALSGAHPMTGHIADGAPADLVLLRQNPFGSIEALATIDGVIVRGEWIDRERLDAVLAELRAN